MFRVILAALQVLLVVFDEVLQVIEFLKDN